MDANQLARLTLAEYSPAEAQRLLDEDVEQWYADIAQRPEFYFEAIQRQMETMGEDERQDMLAFWDWHLALLSKWQQGINVDTIEDAERYEEFLKSLKHAKRCDQVMCHLFIDVYPSRYSTNEFVRLYVSAGLGECTEKVKGSRK